MSLVYAFAEDYITNIYESHMKYKFKKTNILLNLLLLLGVKRIYDIKALIKLYGSKHYKYGLDLFESLK